MKYELTPKKALCSICYGDELVFVTDLMEWAAIIAPVTTLLSGFGGYWLASQNEEARDQRVIAREAAVARAVSEERTRERQSAFQRDTMLELQGELQRLVQSTMKIILRNQEAFNENQVICAPSDKLDAETYEIRNSTQRLGTCLFDSQLRQKISDFVDFCSRCSLFFLYRRENLLDELKTHIQEQLTYLGSAYDAITNELGDLIRKSFA